MEPEPTFYDHEKDSPAALPRARQSSRSSLPLTADTSCITYLASIHKRYYDKLIDMNTVTLSPKYQVVIPLAIRTQLGLTPGEKIRVIRYQDRVELIPVRPIQKLRGILSGIDTTIKREDDRL